MKIQLHDKYFENFIDEKELDKIISQVSEKIRNEYKESSNLVVIGVLNGAIPFFKDLIFKLPEDISIDFIKTSSYGDGTRSSGRVKLLLDNQLDLTDKDVLIVEDIVDSGLTQKFLKEHFKLKKTRSVRVCSLFYKSCNNLTKDAPEFFGLDIPDYFIVGYGLDYAQKGRNIGSILKVIE
ncbi:MAG: hypoxanthine phosphoribosyltransferase [Candidatus Cloacimonadota bacterium]|nr:MAG: hypoxanthine phosphoribosyltransferase [Candidatus Cloacimonadota bacterium]PIE78364.1 MAG: hypoxanthine phosphoribosyltransferase [Candidatus Delongbacteria bacterium]